MADGDGSAHENGMRKGPRLAELNGWRSMGLDGEWDRVVEKLAGMAMSLASGIEQFRDDFGRALDSARKHDGHSEVTYRVSLNLRAPNADGLMEEVARILGLDH
jgi:hypothetical protein